MTSQESIEMWSDESEYLYQHGYQWCADAGHEVETCAAYADYFVESCSGLVRGEWPNHPECFAAMLAEDVPQVCAD